MLVEEGSKGIQTGLLNEFSGCINHPENVGTWKGSAIEGVGMGVRQNVVIFSRDTARHHLNNNA